MVKLFVGGLPFEVKEIDLAKLFIEFGNISTIKVVRDRQTRKCKGYAFIEMEQEEAADQAIAQLNNKFEYEGRILSVNKVEEKAAPSAPAPYRPKPYTPRTSSANNRTDAPGRPRRPRKIN